MRGRAPGTDRGPRCDPRHVAPDGANQPATSTATWTPDWACTLIAPPSPSGTITRFGRTWPGARQVQARRGRAGLPGGPHGHEPGAAGVDGGHVEHRGGGAHRRHPTLPGHRHGDGGARAHVPVVAAVTGVVDARRAHGHEAAGRGVDGEPGDGRRRPAVRRAHRAGTSRRAWPRSRRPRRGCGPTTRQRAAQAGRGWPGRPGRRAPSAPGSARGRPTSGAPPAGWWPACRRPAGHRQRDHGAVLRRRREALAAPGQVRQQVAQPVHDPHAVDLLDGLQHVHVVRRRSGRSAPLAVSTSASRRCSRR